LNNKTLYENYSRLSALKLYDAEFDRFSPPLFNPRGYNMYTCKKISNEHCCGVIDPSLFAINIKTFTESLHFNSCLNRKVSVDKKGYIKNCPSLSNHYGHVDETNLADITKTDDFKKLWNIKKDQISICKDCEFRHICTDCRAYRDNPDDIKSKPLKCGYNPYTAEWEDWSMNPLKQKSIKHYGF
jgi:SPASM domain peptide maturase of grasp-with-spasm system